MGQARQRGTREERISQAHSQLNGQTSRGSQSSAETMRLQKKIEIQFLDKLAGFSGDELNTFFETVSRLTDMYVTGYQFGVTIYLVLDNSVIQSFKHRDLQPARRVLALAFTAFCRFVKDWSDRETYLAVSPAAIYEHLGRPRSTIDSNIDVAMSELKGYFTECDLPMVAVGFSDRAELRRNLDAIAADDVYLTSYFKDIDANDWKMDLSAPIGVKLPLRIAHDHVPDDLPLKYFKPWYVKFVLVGRIEKLIAKQSQHNKNAMPITAGVLTDLLFEMNDFTKKGVLRGLGDIDMLQICDITSQFQRVPSYVMLGQTFDNDLANTLSERSTFFRTRSVEFGMGDTNEQLSSVADFLSSNVFAEEEVRTNKIIDRLAGFTRCLAHVIRASRTFCDTVN